MTQPTHIRAINPTDDSTLVDAIEQHVWRAHSMDKQEVIARILQADGRGLTIIFCRTKRNAQRVSDDLADRGFAAASVHGDLGQGAREQALRAFRNGKVDVLVATDVAARGIDVADVTHVINWECPEDEKTYLHRIGRTGRAGNSGVAVTLVDWDDLHRWKMIAQALGLPFEEPLETYSSSPHIYTGLGIPEGTKGRLPKAKQSRAGLDAEVIEDLGETGASAGKRNKPSSRRDDKGHSDKGHGDRHDRKGHGDKDHKSHDQKSHGEKSHADKDTASDEAPRTPRPDRQRRRTRGGSGDDSTAAPAAASASDNGASATPARAASDGGTDGHGPADDGTGAPRRRRRRGGRGRGGATATDTTTSESSGHDSADPA
jgi:superfamily II DNA/RNA helicase